MAYPTTRETHTNASDTITEIVAEHVNWGYALLPRIEDYVGLDSDTADPSGSITAQVKALQDDVVGFSFPTGDASATHGPVHLTITDTSGHNIIAAPGTGNAVYVTSISCWQAGTTAATLSASDGSARFKARLAATDGAGFVHAFDPPWEVPENTAFVVTLDDTSTFLVDVNFYVDVPTV